MAYVALENGEASALTREDFTVISSEETGKCTLVIPRIAIDLSSEAFADIVASRILRTLEAFEELEA